MAVTPPESNTAAPGRAVSGQGRRRALYGVNVAVALAVALVLVLLVNWFAVWAFGRLPAGVRPWVRYDLTATRSYTLSPQTRRVLSGLDTPVELVGVYRDGAAEAQAVTDLLDEYARTSSAVSVRRLQPETDPAALRELYEAIESGLADASGQGDARAAIDAGVAELEKLADALQARVDDLESVAAGLDPTDAGQRGGVGVVDGLIGAMVGWIDEYRLAVTNTRLLLDEPLPPLAYLRGQLFGLLNDSQTRRLPQLSRFLNDYSRNRDLPVAVRDAALRNRRALEGVDSTLARTVSALSSVAVSPDYERLRGVLRERACVVVRQAERVRVVALSDMFLSEQAGAGPGAEATAAETMPVRFLGEERLTGAIVSAGLAQPPVLVFVSGDGRPVLGQQGRFKYVAERARASGFEVSAWSVVGEDGQSITAAPRIAADRKAVWVVVPADPSRTTDAPSKERIAAALLDRLEAGDGVLLIPGLRRDASVAAVDPVLAIAESAGIQVDPGSVLLRQVAESNSQLRADGTFRLERWPASDVTGSLRGREFWLELALPVTITKPQSVTPIVEVAGDFWVEDEPLAGGELSASTPEDDEKTETQTVGAIAELNVPGRLAVVADEFWATDTVILNRRAGGNAELFANLAYWLAGLDDAIGRSPRTQGRQRIGPMTDTQRSAVRWLVLSAVPAGSLLAGIAVWGVRRRG